MATWCTWGRSRVHRVRSRHRGRRRRSIGCSSPGNVAALGVRPRRGDLLGATLGAIGRRYAVWLEYGTGASWPRSDVAIIWQLGA